MSDTQNIEAFHIFGKQLVTIQQSEHLAHLLVDPHKNYRLILSDINARCDGNFPELTIYVGKFHEKTHQLLSRCSRSGRTDGRTDGAV